MKNILQAYVEADYQEETLESLAWLESSSESLGDLLESYRYLQPDGNLFSAVFIAKIKELEERSHLIARHTEERDYQEKMIKQYEHEIHYIERGWPIIGQADPEETSVPF